jgi:hypothetical protein
VEALLRSLKRHFEDHKEGKSQEWVAFRRVPGEELPSLLLRLQGLALDLEKSLKDKELVGKFVASLDRRLAEQTNTQAMASTIETEGAYSLEEAYDAALMVSAGNARLKIARELAPRAAEASRSRWGSKPAGAHAAIVPEAAQMVAAAPVAPGGSGACHNCGEVGHYRNTCPQPCRNSSGGRNGGAGGRGGGRGRACFVCGELGHLAAECARRVVPVAAAAATPHHERGVSDGEFAKFQAWKAMSQAAAAVEVQGEDSDGSEWEDQGHPLGAVALPVARGPEQGPVPEMAAAGTKAGAEKARATREAKRNAQALRAPTMAKASVPAAVPGVGTQRIASPADGAGLEALKSRRDKAAAKERRSKLPDHGRHIAPQGLNRLPKSFLVGASPGQDQQFRLGQQVGGARSQPGPAAILGPAPAPGGKQPDGNPQGTRVVTPGSQGSETGGQSVEAVLSASGGPALSGGVTLSVLAFLELAEQAGLDLHAVAAMARGVSGGPAVVHPVRWPAEGATMAQNQAPVTQLSPAAKRAQAAWDREAAAAEAAAAVAATVGNGPGGARGLSRVSPPAPMGAGDTSKKGSGTQPSAGDTLAGESSAREEDTRNQLQARVGVRAQQPQLREQPESAAMGAARGLLEADARLACASSGIRGEGGTSCCQGGEGKGVEPGRRAGNEIDSSRGGGRGSAPGHHHAGARSGAAWGTLGGPQGEGARHR